MTYNFRNHKQGDTINEVGFQLLINNAAINITGTNIIATFTLDREKHIMDIGSGLTVTDAATGKFKFDEQVIAWREGKYKMEVCFHFQDGKIKTYLTGQLTVYN